MQKVLWLAASLIVATCLSGCWALWGDPSGAVRPRLMVQDGNVHANEVASERTIRDNAVERYNACLDYGTPGWKCEQYLYPQGRGNGSFYGYGSFGSGWTLGSVARDGMIEIHLAEGLQQDYAQNGAIRDLREDLADESTERRDADEALSGRVDTAQSRADAAYGRASAAAGQAGRANGRLDKAGRQLGTVDSKSRDRDADLHERLRKLEEDDSNNTEEEE
jgi:hypothetical protein